MTPLERLLMEELPDGTFGGARPQTLTTDPNAAAHFAALEAALATRRHASDSRTKRLYAPPDARTHPAPDDHSHHTPNSHHTSPQEP